MDCWRGSETALHWAASNDDVEAVEVLVAAGASQTLTGGVISNGTALWDAAIFAQKNALKALLRLGSDPLQRCPPFPDEHSPRRQSDTNPDRSLLEFLGDDERIEEEVREIIRTHIAEHKL